MRFIPKELKENVNISPRSLLKEFFLLLCATLGIVLIIYIGLGFAVDLVVPKLPPGIETKLGEIYSRAYEDKGDKTAAGIKLQKLLDTLIEELPSREPPYKVHLVHDPMVNALALPGRNIVVFSALIKEVESENGLAFILAHELGHFANKDHLRGLGRTLVMLTISTALLGADNTVTKFLLNSLQNVEMKFSQRQERMADSFGLDLLSKKYGHVAGTVDFFERMSKKEGRGQFLYYFATHPHPEVRLKAIKKQIHEKGYLVKEKIPLDESFLDISYLSSSTE